MKKKFEPFKPAAPKKKESFTYFRIEEEKLKKIDVIRKKTGLRTRSETIREMINWCFDNGIEQRIG